MPKELINKNQTKAFQNINMEGYFKRYGLKYGLIRGIFLSCPFHIVRDYENKKLLYYIRTEKKIRKKYLKNVVKDPIGIQYGSCQFQSPVWVYWEQGINNAPPIVQACIQSIRKFAGDEVILLDKDNVSKYVVFPKCIQQRIDRNQMSQAAFSDVLRFTLLEHFGGTWIDATVYLTDELPKYIIQSELFAFRDSFGDIKNPALMCTWFLHSRKHNLVIRETRNILFDYWSKENYVVEYLLPYIVFTMILEQNGKEFYKIPYMISDYAYCLLNKLDSNNIYEYNHILKLSSIHKLTYKLREEVFLNKENLYHRILTGGGYKYNT